MFRIVFLENLYSVEGLTRTCFYSLHYTTFYYTALYCLRWRFVPTNIIGIGCSIVVTEILIFIAVTQLSELQLLGYHNCSSVSQSGALVFGVQSIN